MARTAFASQDPGGMPEELQFPLDRIQEVDEFENWFPNAENGRKKQYLVSILIRFRNSIVIALVYYHMYCIIVKSHNTGQQQL